MSEVGDLLAGRYRLERHIGSGGMGVVWQATDERLHRAVAVKQLLLQPGLDSTRAEESRQRALREARIAARLHHPHAVTVHDVATDNGMPVLVMEYVPARSLGDILADTGRLEPHSVGHVGAQAASALAAAHAAGIVHRDVKPGNILITDDGTAKITDFGISHAVGDVAITQTGLFAGTPAYLAPETARGNGPTPTSDVFSLGATLYAAVEGTPPFGDDPANPIALLHVVAAGVVPPPRRAGPLTPVLTRMLHPDPGERPSAAHAAEALRAVAAATPLSGVLDQPALTSATRPLGRVPATAPQSGTDRGPTGTMLDAHPVPGTGYGADSPDDPRPPRVRRPRGTVLVTAGILGVLLVIAVLATTLGGGTEPAPTKTAPALTAADMEKAVSGYYRLLPENHEQAWNRLGPALRAQDRQRYRNRWSAVVAVSVISPPRSTGADTVHVGIELVMPDGTKIREFHQLGLLPARPRPLLSSDTTLHAETTAPALPPTHREDNKQDKDEENKDEEKKDESEGGNGRKGEKDKKGEEDKTGSDN